MRHGLEWLIGLRAAGLWDRKTAKWVICILPVTTWQTRLVYSVGGLFIFHLLYLIMRLYLVRKNGICFFSRNDEHKSDFYRHISLLRVLDTTFLLVTFVQQITVNDDVCCSVCACAREQWRQTTTVIYHRSLWVQQFEFLSCPQTTGWRHCPLLTYGELEMLCSVARYFAQQRWAIFETLLPSD